MAAGNFTKPFQIRAWSDLTKLNPLLKAVDKIPKREKARFHFDFSKVENVDAVGLSIHLSFIAKLRETVSDAIYFISMPESKRANQKLTELEVEKTIKQLGFEETTEIDLFSNLAIYNTDTICSFFENGELCQELLISIFPKSDIDRNQSVSEAQTKIKRFFRSLGDRRFAHEQVMIILLEMVKNTLDHSASPAFLGLSFKERSATGTFSFSYCDTGNGIARNVRQYISDIVKEGEPRGDSLSLIGVSEAQKMLRLSNKGGFSDLWHWALQPGNSTKYGNGVNFGLGLTLIATGAHKCGIHLLMKDADSMCSLTKVKPPYSHSEIRQYSIKTSAPQLLMYYGELECLK